MHGEYKTPGGKLVVVDFDVIDGRLRNMVISGDFFLYPEEELAPLTHALEGVDADLDDESFAERIRMDLHPDTELLGTSPEAIATAVRRGLNAGRETQAS
ncbi:MAG TPA: biotin--protein ligase [Thermomicrobiales bacterium]|jgi:lipoate---protein ligase|nr:biotin--protein ligase [Thermomicrobiales bacterium]